MKRFIVGNLRFVASSRRSRWVGGTLLAITTSAATAAVCIPRADPCIAEGNCGVVPVSNANVPALPLLSLNDFDYIGGFSMSSDTFGESSLASAHAVIEHSGNSLFIVGHSHDDAIAEFIIPPLVKTDDVAELPSAGAPVQNFSAVLDRSTSGNPQGIDWITGMAVHDGQLIVNGHRFYDGDGNNTNTTLVVEDAGNIAGSQVRGYYDLPGSARSAGWMSPVPPELRAAIGEDYIVGYSSVTAINSRHSIGPSAHAIDLDDVLAATSSRPEIPTTKLMEFSLTERIGDVDLTNADLTNDLWTYKTGAVFGFIVPGTRTYATIGNSGGHKTGVGYKLQDNGSGKQCGGYCPYDVYDEETYYWLFDVQDLLDVKAGKTSPSSILPYEYGNFPAPFQPEQGMNSIGGGTFDPDSGTLYLTIRGADTLQGRFKTSPVVVAYQFPSIAN